MKKVILLGLTLIGFAYGCSTEKEEYKRALSCYKYHLGQVYEGSRMDCGYSYYKYGFDVVDINSARKWVELAKIDLDMCLMNK